MDTSAITQQDLPLTGQLVIDQEMLRSVFAGCSDVVFIHSKRRVLLQRYAYIVLVYAIRSGWRDRY